MSSIDVRFENVDPVNNIRFADVKKDWLTATNLRNVGHGILIQTDARNSSAMILHSKEDAENLIKALDKAIELGWFDNLK